jgi:hypothetical protein
MTRLLRNDIRAFFDVLLVAEPTHPAVCAVFAERSKRLLAERGPELVARPGRVQ